MSNAFKEAVCKEFTLRAKQYNIDTFNYLTIRDLMEQEMYKAIQQYCNAKIIG